MVTLRDQLLCATALKDLEELVCWLVMNSHYGLTTAFDDSVRIVG